MFPPPGVSVLPTLLLVAVASAATSTCEEPVSTSQLHRVVEVARTAWVVMDRGSFEAATAERRDALPCLAEPVEPELAIELHLHEALAWSLERRSDLSQGAFRAILALQPSWELPLELAPERHRLREDFEEARTGTQAPTRRPFAPPGDGSLLVDGVPAEDVPVDRPFVVQMLDREGAVVRTHYFTPGSEAADGLAWFGYDGEPQGLAPVDPAGVGSRRAPLLFGGSLGMGLVAGGLYAAGAVRAQAMERGELPCEDLPEAQGQVNGLVGAAAGVGVVGIGLGVAGLVVAF